MTCVNCQSEVTTPFCPNCGQKQKVARISLKSISSEVSHRYFGLDTAFLRTFRDLSIRPGEVVRAYTGGNRMRYMGPMAYFIVMGLIMEIAMDLLSVKPTDMFPSDMSETLNRQDPISDWTLRNFRFIPAALIPFYALAMKFIYWKKPMTYMEHMIASIYPLSHMFLFSIIGVLTVAIFSESFFLFNGLLSLVYGMFAYLRIYESGYGFGGLMRVSLGSTLGYVLFLVFGILVNIVFSLLN